MVLLARILVRAARGTQVRLCMAWVQKIDQSLLIDALRTQLVGNTSLATQKTVLIAKLCPTSANQTQCQVFLDQFWAKIAKATFTFLLEPLDTCKGEKLCKTNLTCEEYMTEIGKTETHGTKYDGVVEQLEVSIGIKNIL